MKYIDADKLIAEIERLKSQLVRGACAAGIAMETNCKEEAYNEVLAFINSLPAESCLSECNFKEYLRGVFEANNGIENDPDLLVKLHASTLLELAQKELPDSPDFEAEWEWYVNSRKDDMRTNAVTMNVKEVALYFAKWGRKQVLTAKPSEELEEEIHRYFKELEKSDCVSNTRRLAKHFAEWGMQQFEKNRLAACDAQTKKEYERETAFVDKIIREQHRTPTFSDAINFGIELERKEMMDEWLKDRDGCFWDGVAEGKKAMEKQMMKEAVEGRYMKTIDGKVYAESDNLPISKDAVKCGDKVKLIILKEND